MKTNVMLIQFVLSAIIANIQMVSAQDTVNMLHNELENGTWTFKHRISNRTIHIEPGQKLMIRFIDSNGKRSKVRGTFQSISENSLIISSSNNTSIAIHKGKIVKIWVYQVNTKRRIWSIALLVIGLLMSPIVWRGSYSCIGTLLIPLAVALILIGVILLFTSGTLNINDPFGGAWQIFEQPSP